MGNTTKGATQETNSASLIEECLASRGDGFLDFYRQLEHSGNCSQPVRLRGSMREVDPATGESRLVYSTTREPDGVLLKACGNRRETRCAPCAAVYKGDARHLVRAGLCGDKGVPPSVTEHPSVFVTLTAPSFGTVHRAAADGSRRPCRPARPKARCRHGRRLGCWTSHEEDDPALGQPLCPRCYDYEGAVLWNSLVTELWRRTTIYARRALARVLGLTASELDTSLRLSYGKVVEYQRRGVVHLHVVVRQDGLGNENQLARPHTPVDVGILASAILDAAKRVAVPYPLRNPGRPLRARWGDQIDLSPIIGRGATRSARAVANYVAKYATKSTDDEGVLDRRLRPGALESMDLPDHLRRLVKSALRLGARPELQHLRLPAWAHTLGFRGHWLTKSRRYSTTFGALRAARADWRRSEEQTKASRHSPGRPANVGPYEIDARWTYAGSGHRTRGDAALAAALALGREQARWVAWLEIRTMPPVSRGAA
jgi:hypothetical protein